MRTHLQFSTLGKLGLVLLLILVTAISQMDIFEMEFTGVFLPLRRGHQIDIALILVPFLFVVFVQKVKRKPLNRNAGDLYVVALLLIAFVIFILGFIL